MGARTGISWTERTWNPVTGCDRISAGCDNCYALGQAARLKAMNAKRYQNDGNPTTSGPGFGLTVHRELFEAPLTWKTPQMVFVNSMSDLFHAQVPLEDVAAIFDVMRRTPQHTYQVLTKRASRLPRLVDKLDWPENLWMGVTVEDQDALGRIDALRHVPVPTRFISAEPLLGPLPGLAERLEGISWVIVGGESGPNSRPMLMDWVCDIQVACAQTDTAYFFKQAGSVLAPQLGLSKKGASPAEWPERPEFAQEFPVTARTA